MSPFTATRTSLVVSTKLALSSTPLILLLLLAPLLRLRPLNAICLGFACTIITLQLAAHQWRDRGKRWSEVLAAIIAGAILGILGFFLAQSQPPEAFRSIVGGLFSTLSVLAIGLGVGSAIGQRVPAASHLLPVGLVSSAMDLWSALAPEGVTHTITTAPDPAWLRVLAMSAPVVPSRALEPMLGFGDVVFAALYLAAAQHHQLSIPRMHLALALAFAAAGAMVVVLGRPLPALPFLAVAVVVAFSQTRKIAVEDRKATAAAVLLFVGAVARLLWLRR